MLSQNSVDFLADCVVYGKKPKTTNKHHITTVDELVRRTGDIQKPVCHGCKFSRNCPFYEDGKVCAIVSSLLNTEERSPNALVNLAPLLLAQLTTIVVQSKDVHKTLKRLQLAVLYLFRLEKVERLETTSKKKKHSVNLEIERQQRIERLGLPIVKKHSRVRMLKRNGAC